MFLAMRTLLALLLSTIEPLVAQKMPDPQHGGGEVQLFVVERELGTLFGQPTDDSQERSAQVRREQLAKLCGALRVAMWPPLADPSCLQPLGDGVLVLRAGSQQQGLLPRVLRYWSKLGHIEAGVKVRTFLVPNASFTPTIREALGAPADSDDEIRVVLADDAAARLVEVLEAGAGVQARKEEVLHVEKGEPGSYAATKMVRYRRDYLVDPADGEPKFWPLVGELADGLSLEVRAVPVDDDRTAVRIDASWLAVELPIPSFVTTLAGGGGEVEIDLPTTSAWKCSVTERLRRDQVGVIVCRALADGTRHLILV